MAVVAVWKCDRDGAMFANKKDAEEHDKMLELAENISAYIEANIEGLDEKHSEAIGLLLSRHREELAKACKGKPEILLEIPADSESSDGDKPADKQNITPIAGTA
ncbi:YebG family protein [Agaribacterium haliotis]|uniref:YebG family protein n=1 Tax=Agaribacterium haliotis TaxID=2013869 RepID=UPI000BB54B8C|nr:YebG family protein [Agaribacterium haliotis]